MPPMSRPSWIAIVVASLLTGCFYPADRGKLLETRFDRLQGENESLRAELEQTQKSLLPRIDEKVAEVTVALQSLDKASRRSSADTGVLLQKTIEDMALLQGQVETYLHQLSELREKLQEVQDETERKLTALAGPEAMRAAEARRRTAELERPREPRPFLELAAQKRKDEPQVARRLYDEFFKTWPKDPLVGEAHFGLGEVFFAENKCREALFEYGKVIQEHPKTSSAPEAYLRSSDCFARLKMNAEAKLALEEVVRSHPKSEAAKTARTRLAKMGKGR
jgi:tol-pal system protein YbgF